jgi:hypothetical protein
MFCGEGKYYICCMLSALFFPYLKKLTLKNIHCYKESFLRTPLTVCGK